MDDVLLISYEDFDGTQRLIDLMLTCFSLFGLTPHMTKSVLFPSDDVQFLGFDVFADGRLRVSNQRSNKIRSVAKKLLMLHNS